MRHRQTVTSVPTGDVMLSGGRLRAVRRSRCRPCMSGASPHALVAAQRGLPPRLARENAALAALAADALDAADLGAVPALAGRRTPAARVEGGRSVDALVPAGAEHDARELVGGRKVVLDGLGVGAASEEGSQSMQLV